jgi:hypothetical protein
MEIIVGFDSANVGFAKLSTSRLDSHPRPVLYSNITAIMDVFNFELPIHESLR